MGREDLELIEVLHVLRKRPRLVGGAFLSLMTLVLFTPGMPRPSYEASATLKVGLPVTSPEDPASRLRNVRLLAEIVKQLDLDLPPDRLASRIKTTLAGDSVRVIVRSQDPEEGLVIVRRLAEELIVSYEAERLRFEKELQKLDHATVVVQQQLNILREASQHVEEKIRQDRAIDPSLQGLLEASVQDKVRALLDVQQTIINNEQLFAVMEVGIISTQVARLSPWLPPVQRGLAAVLIGLLGSLPAVVLVEYLQRMRQSS